MDIYKKDLKKYVGAYDYTHKNYSSLFEKFRTFEDVAVDYFSEGDIDSRTFTHSKMHEFSQQANDNFAQQKNPMKEMYLWAKGEYLDIKGMTDAMAGRDQMLKTKKSAESSLLATQSELQKLTLGKTTLKSFFKSKSGKENSMLKRQTEVE